MEGKGLLKVMLPRFWLLMQTGSALLGRSPASAWGQGQARSLGQRARSRLTGADAARSVASGSPGASAGCSGLMSVLGLSCAAVHAVCSSRYSCGPFGEKGGLFPSAVDDACRGCRGQQGCGFLPAESSPQAWQSCCPGSRKHLAKWHFCGFSLLAPLQQVPLCGYVFGTRKCGSGLRGDLYPEPSQSPNATVAARPWLRHVLPTWGFCDGRGTGRNGVEGFNKEGTEGIANSCLLKRVKW